MRRRFRAFSLLFTDASASDSLPLSSLVALVVLPEEVTASRYNFSGLTDVVVECVLSVEGFPEEVWEILEYDVFLDCLDMGPDSHVMSETFVAFEDGVVRLMARVGKASAAAWPKISLICPL
jgi:hypothetical protein